MTYGETNSVQKSKVRMSNTKQERKQGSLKKFGGRIRCHGGEGILTDHTRHVFCRSRENN